MHSEFRSSMSIAERSGIKANKHRYYCLSILDKHHHPDIDLEQGLKIFRMCTDELKRRLPIDFKGMYVKIITKDGIKEHEWDDTVQVLPA